MHTMSGMVEVDTECRRFGLKQEAKSWIHKLLQDKTKKQLNINMMKLEPDRNKKSARTGNHSLKYTVG